MPPKKTSTVLARPVGRYRPGIAPAAPVNSDSEDDEATAEDQMQEDELEQGQEDEEKPKLEEPGRGIKIGLRDVVVDQQGAVRVGGLDEVGRTEREKQDELAEDEESEEEVEEEEEKPVSVAPRLPMPPGSDDGSSEYETDSDEEPAAPLYKPVFVFKRNRETILTREQELAREIVEEKRLAEEAARKKISHDLVAETLIREMAEKEVEEVFPDIDDTDGLAPSDEFEQWKLRELKRIQREVESAYAREKEREEVEARRALPEGLRMKEDIARAQKSRDEKAKGSQVFLQKYHHKGAFYTDQSILSKHDYTAPTASMNRNIEDLPKAMQVRNFGKMSQSKYTHLAKEDTGNFGLGRVGGTKPPGGGLGGMGSSSGEGCFTCGGPHLKRDCTQDFSGGGASSSGGGGFGAPGGAPPSTTRDNGWAPRLPALGEGSTSATAFPSRGSDASRSSGGGKGAGIGYSASNSGSRREGDGDRWTSRQGGDRRDEGRERDRYDDRRGGSRDDREGDRPRERERYDDRDRAQYSRNDPSRADDRERPSSTSREGRDPKTDRREGDEKMDRQDKPPHETEQRKRVDCS